MRINQTQLASLDLTREQIRISRKGTQAQLAASTDSIKRSGTALILGLTLKNTGTTAALHTNIVFMADLSDDAEQPIDINNLSSASPNGLFDVNIAPASNSNFSQMVLHYAKSDERKRYLFIAGLIYYQNVYDDIQKQPFCLLYDLQNNYELGACQIASPDRS